MKTPPGDGVMQTKSDREFGDDLHRHFNKEADSLKSREVELAEQVKAAREYLDTSADQFKVLWMDWIDESKKALLDMRQLRMALEGEARLVKAALGDLKAAIDSNESTVDRASDFITQLEKIKEMHASGFLKDLTEVCLKVLK